MEHYSLALDLGETCLVRSEAVTLISCLIDYNAVS